MKKKSKELLYIWMTAVSFTTILLIVFVLIYVIFINSVGHFWTSPLQLFQLQGGEQVLGIMQKTEKNLKREERIQVKIGNRDFYELDFRWLEKKNIEKISTPKDIFQIERRRYQQKFLTVFFHQFFQKLFRNKKIQGKK